MVVIPVADELDQFREELTEVVSKFLTPRQQVGHRRFQFDRVTRHPLANSLRQSKECVANSFRFGIGKQPVRLNQPPCQQTAVVVEPGQMFHQNLVNAIDEGTQRFRGPPFPVNGQKMIVVHVDQHARVPSPPRRDPRDASLH